MTTVARTAVTRRKKTAVATASTATASTGSALAGTCYADADTFAATAEQFREAANLEETLAHYLLAVASLQHGLDATATATAGSPPQTKTKADRTAQLQQWLAAVETLHATLQAKKDHFHACLDDDVDTVPLAGLDDDEKGNAGNAGDAGGPDAVTAALVAPASLDCSAVVPVDTTRRQVTLASIVGNEGIKADILHGIVQPFVQPLLFKVRRSFLFYGPPGTGKTLFARASAHSLRHAAPHLDVLYYAPTSDQLKDKHVGGTEKKISTYFRCVEQHAAAREALLRRQDPKHTVLGVVFLDELDSLARARDQDDGAGINASATNTLLQMMDGFTSLAHVVVMGATNYPWQLDAAILSRFQSKIYVRLPDEATVGRLVEHYLLDHWHRTLGLPDVATVPVAERERRFELYSHLCGMTPAKVELVTRRLFAPLTYSPSNIKDVCQLSLRKSARLAHAHGVFHLVRTKRTKPGLTSTERELLAHCEGRYASAATYARLRTVYPSVVEPTPGVTVSRTTRGAQSRPDTLDIGGHAYLYTHAHPKATPVVRALGGLELHAYVGEATKVETKVETKVNTKETGDEATTQDASRARAERTTSTPPLPFALYQTVPVTFGDAAPRTFVVVATGQLEPYEQGQLIRDAEAGALDLQRYLESLFDGTARQQVLRRIDTVYVRDATDVSGPFTKCAVHDGLRRWTEHKKQSKGVDVSGTKTSLTWSVVRLVAWLSGEGTGTTVTKDARREQRPERAEVTLGRGTTAATAEIEAKAFSLDVRTDAFLEATDPENADSVRASSNSEELGRFERWWKEGVV